MSYFLISYFISFLFLYLYYFYSKRKKYHQTERLLGPSSHKYKNGTITSGGIIFNFAVVISFIILNNINLKSIFLLFPLFSYTILGFIDDFIIIKKENNEGLSKKVRIFIELVLASITFFIYLSLGFDTVINLGFIKMKLYFFYGFYLVFLFVSSSNAYNLSDGLDLLLVSMTFIILMGFLFIANIKNNQIAIYFIYAYLGSILAFSFFNFPKAFIFMGDSGSLGIGVSLAILSILLNEEWLFIWFSIPAIFETLSVIIQVSFFKMTKGKRFFKMAPFHHHLELLGFNESRVVYIFSFAEALFVLSGLYLGGYL